MSLQQILSMVQRCLKRWWYYFSNVYHQLMQHVFHATSTAILQHNVFCQCKHFWAKTSVNTAGKTLEKCICGICNGPVKNHLCVCIGWTCNSAIPPCLSGLIWINQKPTQNKKPKTKTWQPVLKPEYFAAFFCSEQVYITIEANKKANKCL